MSENQNIEIDETQGTSLDELNDEGAGLGATPEAPSSFEPEEPEHPADDK